MKYKLFYAYVPYKLFVDPNRADYGVVFVFDKDNNLYAEINESCAIILKLKYPDIILQPIYDTQKL